MVTLEGLRAELQDFAQHAMRTELQVFRDSFLEEMQTRMSSFAAAPLTCSSAQNNVSQCKSNEHESKEQPRQASAICCEPVHQETGRAEEASSLPRRLLDPMVEHSAMEDSERLLKLNASEEPKSKKHIHHHHGSSRTDLDLQQKTLDQMTCWERVRRRMNDVVASESFEILSGLMVLVNACYLGYQTDWVARNWSDSVPAWFQVADIGCCAMTVCEVTARIIAGGLSFFYAPGCAWNWFDLCVGSTQVLDVSMSLVNSGSDGKHKALSGARMLKLVRIFRIARIASVFPQLHVLISSIVNSLSSLFWTLVLIFAFLYGFAIALTQVVNDHKMQQGEQHMELHEEEILELFGTLHKSMISLYMIISEGIHWGELCDPLAEHISPWMRLAFVLFVGFMLFAMMNIITACFVDSAMKIAAKAESEECLNRLWQMMEDSMPIGSHVTKDVFVSHFDLPGMAKFLELTDAEGENAEQIFGLIDESGDGKLDADEFVECCGRLMGGAKAMQVKKDIFALKDEMLNQLRDLKALQQKTAEQLSQQATNQFIMLESRLLSKMEGIATDAASAVAASSNQSSNASPSDRQNKKSSLTGMFSPR